MPGRNRVPRHGNDYRGYHDAPLPSFDRGLARPLPLHRVALEEEFGIQQGELRRIVAENRLIIDENMHRQRELKAAKEEIVRLGYVIPKIRAEKEVQTRELIERVLKLEAEVRAAELQKAEVVQLRAEVQSFNEVRRDLFSHIHRLTSDVGRLQTENKQLTAMKIDMDKLRMELAEARTSYEFEKKANEGQVAQKQTMERNLISMAREIERLRAGEQSAERRVIGLGSGDYGVANETVQMRYAGGAFGDAYVGRGPYDNHVPPRR